MVVIEAVEPSPSFRTRFLMVDKSISTLIGMVLE